VRRYFGDRVFQIAIQRNVRLSEAPSFGMPVLLYDALSVGTRNYMALAKEVLRNNQRFLHEPAGEDATAGAPPLPTVSTAGIAPAQVGPLSMPVLGDPGEGDGAAPGRVRLASRVNGSEESSTSPRRAPRTRPN
jgi:hypothetical protein